MILCSVKCVCHMCTSLCRSEKYAGTLLANIPDTQGGVTPLHLVTYVLLGQQDSNEAEPRSDSPLRR